MKICWDNLEKIKYKPKEGKWTKGFEYFDECERCGEPFLGRRNKKEPPQYCSRECQCKNNKGKKIIVLKYQNQIKESVIIKKLKK